MKTVDEMADELCRMVAGHGLGEAASTRVSSYRAAATYVLDLIAHAKAPSPGDEMTDEEVARELRTFQHGSGWIGIAVRARELFRPGSKAPEEKGEEPYFVRQLRSDLDNTIAVARKLALHARDLMAAARVRENADELKELVEEWADVGDPDDPEDRDGV